MPNSRRRPQPETNVWIGYTDLLSNSLLILLITIVITALARASNEKPPLLRLTEQESFRFPTGSYTLSPGFRAALDRRLPEIRDTINRYRIDSVEVIGHTDNVGGAAYNQDLSQRRAVAVAEVLRNSGVPSGRIATYGRGEDAPVASNQTDYGRAQNRRVEIIIRPTR